MPVSNHVREADAHARLFARWHSDNDTKARDTLLEDLMPRLHAYARRRLSPHLRQWADSGDLVQDCMTRLLGYGPRFMPKNDRQLYALASRVVVNRIRDLARGEAARPRLCSLDSDSSHGRALAKSATTAMFEREEEARQTSLAIEFLPDRARQVIQLRIVHGLEFPEIAERLGLTVGAVRRRYQRGVLQLGGILRRLRGIQAS